MDIEKRMALWTDGKCDQDIAIESGCSVATVCRWRARLNLPPNTSAKRITRDQQCLIVKMLANGSTISEVSQETGIFSETIRKMAIRKKIPYAKSNRRTPGKEVFGTLGYGGYVEMRVDLGGPYGNLVHHGGEHTGYAPLHRMRMQDKLGRKLKPGECVHHIDGDIYNNSLVNLQLFDSFSGHRAHHLETGVHRCKEAADRWPGSRTEPIRL